jgi:hypothetical protein
MDKIYNSANATALTLRTLTCGSAGIQSLLIIPQGWTLGIPHRKRNTSWKEKGKRKTVTEL